MDVEEKTSEESLSSLLEIARHLEINHRKKQSEVIEIAWNCMQELGVKISTLECESRKDLADKAMQCRHDLAAKISIYYWSKLKPIARRVAKKFGTSSCWDSDDADQVLYIKIFDSVLKYDSSKGTTFEQYFNSRERSMLVGCVIDMMRTFQDIPRSVAEGRRRIRNSVVNLSHKLGYKASIDQTAAEDKEIEDKVTDPLISSLTIHHSTAVSSECRGEDSFEFSSFFHETRTEKPFAIPDEAKAKLRDKILSVLSEEQRTAIFFYYWQSCNLKDIARILNCSIATVSKLIQSGKAKISENFPRETLNGILQREDF